MMVIYAIAAGVMFVGIGVGGARRGYAGYHCGQYDSPALWWLFSALCGCLWPVIGIASFVEWVRGNMGP